MAEMYLSRMTLNYQGMHPMQIYTKSSPYGIHKEVYRVMLPSGGRRYGEDKFLFRRAASKVPMVYVLGPRPAEDPTMAWTIESKLFNPLLEAGSRFEFDVRIQPTEDRVDKDGKIRRHQVITSRWVDAKRETPDIPVFIPWHETAKTWLEGAGDWLGVRFDHIVVNGEERITVNKPEQPLTVTLIDYVGALTVADPDRFRYRLQKGIGTARAFGGGLFLLRSPLI